MDDSDAMNDALLSRSNLASLLPVLVIAHLHQPVPTPKL